MSIAPTKLNISIIKYIAELVYGDTIDKPRERDFIIDFLLDARASASLLEKHTKTFSRSWFKWF
jgi:hypothetical protein